MLGDLQPGERRFKVYVRNQRAIARTGVIEQLDGLICNSRGRNFEPRFCQGMHNDRPDQLLIFNDEQMDGGRRQIAFPEVRADLLALIQSIGSADLCDGRKQRVDLMAIAHPHRLHQSSSRISAARK